MVVGVVVGVGIIIVVVEVCSCGMSEYKSESKEQFVSKRYQLQSSVVDIAAPVYSNDVEGVN